MDKIIDNQFSRVEKALSTLIQSIATYNPSPQLATDLVVADQELSQGLELLSQHQSNHARIEALRSTSTTLDDQIKSTLTLLASTRAELLATPATVFPTDTNPIHYSELLSYARRISKFTIPPTFREAASRPGTPPSGALVSADIPDAGKDGMLAGQAEITTNGTTTPIVTNGALNSGAATPVPAAASAEPATSLPGEWSEFLDPLSGGPGFVPWPTEEKIRQGALASIQVLLDAGVDPATFDPERSAELEAERKRLELEAEALRVQQEAERAQAEQERREELRRRESVSVSLGGAPRVEAQSKVFTGLDILEDDMDEDED